MEYQTTDFLGCNKNIMIGKREEVFSKFEIRYLIY
jgi:hypothetical protein